MIFSIMHITDRIYSLLQNAAHKVALLVVLFVAVMLCACSSDSGNDEPDTTTRTVNVTLTLAVNPTSNSGAAGSKAFTRSTRATTTFTDGTWDPIDHPEAGVGFENYIDAERLHVVFYNADGSRLAEVQNKVLLTTDDKNIYQVKGDMRIAAGGDLNAPVTFTGKVVVYANVDAPTDASSPWYLGSASIKDVADKATFSYSAPTTATPAGIRQGGMEAIPMWGMQDYASTPIELRGGLYSDLGTIYLLRSMAKVSLHFTKEMREAGFQFTDVKLNNYNLSGAVAPPYANFSALTTTTALTYARSFNVPEGITSSAGPLNFLAHEGDTVSLNLYIPEYQNVPTGDTRVGTLIEETCATITVGIRRVLNGVTTDYEVTKPLYFADYTDGRRPTEATDGYDIVRNHHYRYFILNDHLDLRLVVEPWTVVRHSNPIEI